MKSSARVLALLILLPYTASAERYFPPGDGVWETTTPESAGLSAQDIARAGAYAQSQKTSSLIIVHNGRMVAEQHWSAADEKGKFSAAYQRGYTGTNTLGHPIEDVASVQKSLISFLAGIAVTEEKLDLMAPASRYLGNGWSKATREQEDAILVWHLMTMTTGLGNLLRYQEAPGTKWAYNTNAYSKMVPVLEKAFGESIQSITRERIANPIGMTDTEWIDRLWAKNNPLANSIGLNTTARDLARFGILVLNGGAWGDSVILDNPDFLKQSLNSSQSHNPAYGLLWWLNGKHSYVRANRDQRVAGSMIPSAPEDMVFAAGALGRKLYIVPSRDLVVVRIGDQHEAIFDDRFWALLLGKN